MLLTGSVYIQHLHVVDVFTTITELSEEKRNVFADLLFSQLRKITLVNYYGKYSVISMF